MAIPGSNLLRQALRVIGKQTVTYHHFTGRVLNEIGLDVAQYAAARPMCCSFQPVPQNVYQVLGLDLQKEYWNLYAARDVLDISRGVSGDQITFAGNRYECLSATPWASVDGWNAVLCVHIGDANAR